MARTKLNIGDICLNGHLVTEETSYVYPEGARLAGKVVCKICRMNWQRKRKGLPESDTIGTWNRNKTHCSRGHMYDEGNTRIKSDGSRGCKTCHRQGMRRRAYGIEWEQFEEMWEDQDESCAICKTPFKDTSEACVDHSHDTGEVRGLLCNQCNNGLGRFMDNITILQSAITYLTNN